MKRIFTLFLVLVICCSSLFIPTFAKSGADVKVGEYMNEDRWISLSKNTTGPRYFVDSKGNPVNLFGMARSQSYANDENRLYSTTSSSDDLFEHYADYGCNFIRLAINLSSLCKGVPPTSEQIDEFITQTVDPDVQAIIRNGMYVMLDIHMYPQQDKYVSFSSAKEFIQYPREYYTPVLKGLAKFYKDEPMIAVYEVWNEPVAADKETVPYEYEEWNTSLREYFMEAVDEIRKIDTRHVIMVSDHNAGWGMCTGNTWGGYYNKIDPVYRNTCFSVHVARSHTTQSFASYSSYYKSLTRDNNICILFGEIETEGDLMEAQGIKNLTEFFSETENEYHFCGVLWRPHNADGEYTSIWGDSGWAKKYCKPQPRPTARYASEAEDRFGETNENIELLKESDLFGYKTGTGISLKPNLKTTQYYESQAEVVSNVVYKEGKYTLYVRACGKKGYDGDFIVGYRDVDGVVHQIARFDGKNTNGEHYYQSVDFTSKKKIVSFVYFSCEKSKKSAIIDRVYIEGAASDKETSSRTKTDFKDINKIIDLSGKSYAINGSVTDSGNGNVTSEINNNKTESNSSNTDDSVDSKPENGDNNNNTDENSQNTQADYSGSKTTVSATTEGFDYTLYIWIGAGVLGFAALFVITCIIVVKTKNKKGAVKEEP